MLKVASSTFPTRGAVRGKFASLTLDRSAKFPTTGGISFTTVMSLTRVVTRSLWARSKARSTAIQKHVKSSYRTFSIGTPSGMSTKILRPMAHSLVRCNALPPNLAFSGFLLATEATTIAICILSIMIRTTAFLGATNQPRTTAI